jgi:hypothetical protein
MTKVVLVDVAPVEYSACKIAVTDKEHVVCSRIAAGVCFRVLPRSPVM